MCNNDHPYSKNQHGKQIDSGFFKGPIVAHTQILVQGYHCFYTEELNQTLSSIFGTGYITILQTFMPILDTISRLLNGTALNILAT